jgi:uncharacterized protein YaaN involved in tellurite resistance
MIEKSPSVPSDAFEPKPTAQASAMGAAMDDLLSRMDQAQPPGSALSQLPADSRVDLSRLNEPQRQRVAELAARATLEDTTSAMSFGADAQRRANDHLDRLMGDMRAVDGGEAGDLLINLSHGLSHINLPRLRKETEGGDWVANTFGRIPLIGRYFSALRHFHLSHQRVVDLLGKIETQANSRRASLAAKHGQMDRLVQSTMENIGELELHLAAGCVATERFRLDFEREREAARASRDPMAAARLRDFSERSAAFETRLVRMHLAYADALVSVPEIRLAQEASRIEMANIVDTLLFDLPRLKRAILRVASLAEISRARKETQRQRDAARRIGALGADALAHAYLGAKASQGDGIEEVAALSIEADKVLETMALGMKLDQENRARRDGAHAALASLRSKLADGLRAHGDQIVLGDAPKHIV